VVIDLLTAPEITDLQDGYEALEHDHHRASPFASGFNTTMYDARHDHRRRVLEVLDRTVGGAIDRAFANQQLFVGNFAVKLPEGESVPFHLDWSFVDEPGAVSAGVWCAVYDTDECNGTLGMVRGSHRHAPAIRAVNERTYEPFETTYAATPDQCILPLRAGQAVVYNSRTAHFSPANATGSSRVAAACTVAPIDAPLSHFWYDDDGRLERFEVTRDFYLTYTVGSPPQEAEGILRSEIVETPR